jgi:hypothetical protein
MEKWGGEGKSGAKAQFRPTIDLAASFFHSLSLERTPPRRDFMIAALQRRRSARSRYAENESPLISRNKKCQVGKVMSCVSLNVVFGPSAEDSLASM